MKIQIKGEKNLTLVLPTRLLFSKKVAHLVTKAAGKWIPAIVNRIPAEILDAALDELVRTKKIHGSWELVDIESASGEKIRITL